MIGIVYCIREISSDKIIYVGSTTNLKARINNHIYHCYTRNKQYPLYLYIREKTTKDDFYKHFDFEILYTSDFQSTKELRAIEQRFLNENSETVLNKTNAFSQIEDKAEWRRQYMKKYYSENEDYRKRTIEIALNRYYSKNNLTV